MKIIVAVAVLASSAVIGVTAFGLVSIRDRCAAKAAAEDVRFVGRSYVWRDLRYFPGRD